MSIELNQFDKIFTNTKCEDGRSNLINSGEFNILYDKLINLEKLILNSYEIITENDLNILVVVLRSIRNSCAGCQANAVEVQNKNVIYIVSRICKYIALRNITKKFNNKSDNNNNDNFNDDNDEENKDILKILSDITLVSAQIIANFSACGMDQCIYIWTNKCKITNSSNKDKEIFLYDCIRDIIAASLTIRNRKAIAAIFASIYYSLLCSKSELESTSIRLLNIFCSPDCRALCCQLLLSISDNKYNQENKKNSNSKNNEDIDPVLEWFHLLGNLLVSRGPRCNQDDVTDNTIWDEEVSTKSIENLGENIEICSILDASIDKNIACLSHEQVIVLHMVRNVFEDTIFASLIEKILIKENNKSNNNNEINEGIINLSYDFNIFLNILANKICSVDINKLIYLSNTKSISSSSATTTVEMKSISSIQEDLLHDSISLCLLVIGTGLSLVPKCTRQNGILIRASLVNNTKILDFCLKILAGRGASDRISQDVSSKLDINDKNLPSDSKKNNNINWEELESLEREIIKSCLQLLGNIIYSCKIAQDLIRNIEGIPVVLSHCATDFNNPFSREWALLCIRNICEENNENQNYIDKLKLQGVIQDNSLSENGINIEIDPEKGKFRINYKDEN